ncbi:hypothetical protein MKX34_26655 [Paenibacillus sp. FSL R5-0636]|uniref:hypothetical protein n=1 Tax=Paenibacillus TaxID=44249 RepID=UPI00096F8C40|nr:hypothetical protein [Paenibacillus odorifer]OMC99170.1 hypothetical protein BJP49_30045 [Paenibacillus odorifer]
MKKPFYKKWVFWVIVIVIGGIIGILNGKDDPAKDVAIVTTAQPTQETASEQTSKPTEDPASTPNDTAVNEVETQIELPTYEIIDERLDKSGMWYLTLSTEATDEGQLKALVENARLLALENNNGATSVFVDIQQPGLPGYIAKGKIALSSKGVAQTGLSNTEEIEFELLK